ncbi:MAG: hypothetical protein JNJ46_24350 [Myxococcales bacterium]|nr:hypothetical protein [Myxococcales bacterium]
MSTSDGSAVVCSTSADTSYHAATKVVTGLSQLSCMAAGDLSLRLCLYFKAPSAVDWGDPLICKSGSGSSQRSLSLDVQIALGTSGPLDYRCVAEPQVNGASLGSTASSPIRAP